MIRGAMASTRSMAGAMASTRGGGTPWYRAGGAPLPIAVYEAKGAASLAASYVNVVNPGTFDAAPGVAPTHAPGTGWGFNNSAWLNTGITPANDQTWAILIRFSNYAAAATDYLTGTQAPTTFATFALGLRTFDSLYSSGGTLAGTFVTNGTVAIAANKGYLNGTPYTGTISSLSGTFSGTLALGALRRANGSINDFLTGNIQYVVIWDASTDHATWMPAVSAAVAAL